MQIFKEIQEISNILKENEIVLDIETTGVSRINSHVVIFSILDSNGEFIQYAIDNENEEEKLLEIIYELLNNKRIITYNGKNFDIPFLKSRFSFYGMEAFEEDSQFDIYRYLISNRLYTDIQNFSLQNIEKYYGIERFENFEKEEDVNFYSSIRNIDEDVLEDLEENNKDLSISDNDIENLRKILLHNKYDVINTYYVLKKISTIEDSKDINLSILSKIGIDISAKINEILIDKNILQVSLAIKKPEIEHYYNKDDYELIISDSMIIRCRIQEGYISDDVLGFVHIFQNAEYFIKYHSSNTEFRDSSKYKLPPNIFPIFDGRYLLDNIKLIIEYTLGYLLS